MNINETLEMRENHRKKWDVSTKLLRSRLPLITNFQAWYLSLDNFVLFCYLVSKLSNIKKACMLMKPLEMKAYLA